jgi:hypothetical protein
MKQEDHNQRPLGKFFTGQHHGKLSAPRPDAGTHSAGDKHYKSQGGIVYLRSDVMALKNKRRRCQPKAYQGVQPTHPESMEGMYVAERS